METIKTYLDNMFQHLPKTQEILRAKEELFNMMEDKYNELKADGKTENEAIGIVISEFGNFDEISKEFNLNSTKEKQISLEKEKTTAHVHTLGLDEAKAYIETMIKSSLQIAIGVFLCICSPVFLIVFSETSKFNFLTNSITFSNHKNDIFIFIGLLALFAMVATAVGLFIISGMRLDKYEFMKKEIFQIDFATESYLKAEKEQYHPTFSISITIGVMLCVLSVIPVLTGYFLFPNGIGSTLGIAMLLVMVAIGVFLFITSGMRKDAYEILLQEKEYTPSIKKRNSAHEKISSIYWTLITAIYLGWSFITFDWGRTWIIWPIAGVLFAVISSVCTAIFTDNKNQ